MKHTIESLKMELALTRSQRDYWRRRALNPGGEASRKARWRRNNPAKYDLEIFKNRIRTNLKKLP